MYMFGNTYVNCEIFKKISLRFNWQFVHLVLQNNIVASVTWLVYQKFNSRYYNLLQGYYQ